ncbi:MAG: glycoside hydrolase family 38 C-terminal domain-containing protein [Eisenbergiella porci]|uniref:alpha-mannosidase n=1 Tax=Eisenbergiella porci TaxID=2652274 RepID=UPI002A749F04|nr:glycoside hydrolase family 38 C-terminal domain-containing protein [Eisenbergiella porci]MDY2651506.1 glycoside hydrolase family 38 C-terminal domain-containing protein [Eisenbergiella porci]
MEKEKTLYMIGNAHLDPVWLWQWQEGYQEVKATFRSALDRMKEYDDFFFTSSSAAYYEWVEENEPAMFEEIRERVKEGRWVIVGGWWIQPDCNAPGGESYVRQGLYGQRYFQEKLGVTAQTGYNVDSFGHNGMLPQILKKSGMDNYVFMRPGRHEKGLEGETFTWTSNDGSAVTAFRIPFEYCTWPRELKEHIERCAGEIKDPRGSIMCFYGVGNHGGGPTKQNIESIHELNRAEDMPRLILSTPDDYFQAVKQSGRTLPVVSGELFHHSSGCYSAHSEVKRLNRLAENRLIMAEKLSVAGKHWAGGKYPLEKYTESWKKVLFNQFHDIMAGTSIEPAYEDARESYGAALDTAARGLNAAVQSISWHIDIPMEEDMKPIVVFNPNAFSGKFEVEMESPCLKENQVLVDEEGTQIPLQTVQSLASSNGRTRLVFIAELPALGYRTYRLVIREAARTFPDVECSGNTAENRWFKIAFDEKTGYIFSLYKKNDGTEYFSGPAAVPVVIEDKSDTWSHGVRIFDKVKGRFEGVSVKRVECGPVKCVIRVTSTYGSSRIFQDFSIYRELDYIRVKTTVDWHEKMSMLKLRFPMQLNYLRASWEIPYGVAQREPNGEEYPMQNFLDTEGANPGLETAINGLSFLNDGKSSGSIAGKEVSMTVLRSPIYANHEPYQPDENLEYVYVDQGVQTFTYGLYPHDGSWEDACTVQRSRELNEKPIALFETYHKGELPQSASFLSVSANNVLVTVMKEAEDGSGDLILRLVETAGRACETQVEVHGLNREFTLAFTPFEIKTVRIPVHSQLEILENDLLEREEARRQED